MAEKSAKPRASASLRSARPMRRTVGRARIVSAPMRTCSCAMVVPPEQAGSPCRSWSRRAATRSYINVFGAGPADRNDTPAIAAGHCGSPAGPPICCRDPGATSPAGEENPLPDGDPSMPRDIVRRAEAIPATSMIALAIGAAAFGAIAVGALAIGRVAPARMTVKKARFQALEVDELTVRKLRVREYDGPPPPA